FKSPVGASPKWETLSGKLIECSSVSGSAEFTSERLGVIEYKFIGCAAKVLGITVKCTGLEAGDKVGEILFKAEFHLRTLLNQPTPLGSSLAVLLGHVHFECTGVLFLALGAACSDDIRTAKGGELVERQLLSSWWLAYLTNGSAGDQV